MVQVTVEEGVLVGELIENPYGGHYYSYKGIPYAEPPLGELRFKAPKPAKKWTGVRKAIEHSPVCHQYDLFTGSVLRGSEDCLYINVYSPDIAPRKPLPVMVWFHGGGFISGSGNSHFYGPEYLVSKNVIMVSFNYRLEVLGFLCLHTEDVPGNAGMKDQVQALRWVKKNIASFGGDPNNITVFGESIGSTSIAFHLSSPMSKGLFNRALMQSGVSTSCTSHPLDPKLRAIALARKLGKYTEDDHELYKFFKAQPIEKLIWANVSISLAENTGLFGELKYAIANEKQFGDNERFFYGDQFGIHKTGIDKNIDVMIGYTPDEGIVLLSNHATSKLKEINFGNYLEYFVPKNIARSTNIRQQLEIGKKFKQHYYGNSEVTVENIDPFVKFIGFDVFTYDIVQFAKTCVAGSNNVYMYKFNCFTERNIMSSLILGSDKPGQKNVVCHADDLMYLFNESFIGMPVDRKSKSFKMIQNMTTLWTNFAKYGNPTPDNSLGVTWPKYSLHSEGYLDINEALLAKQHADSTDMALWESVFEEYLPQALGGRHGEQGEGDRGKGGSLFL